MAPMKRSAEDPAGQLVLVPQKKQRNEMMIVNNASRCGRAFWRPIFTSFDQGGCGEQCAQNLQHGGAHHASLGPQWGGYP